MDDLATENPDKPSDPFELKGARRWCCSAGALVFLVAGLVSAFRTENQAGTAALLVVGAGAGLMALAGRLPETIKHDKTEMAFSRPVDKALSDVLANAPVEDPTAQALAKVVNELAPYDPDSQAVEAARSYLVDARVQFVTRTLQELRRIGAEYGLQLLDEYVTSKGKRFDGALLTTGRDQVIAVHILPGNPRHRDAHYAKATLDMSGVPEVGGGLIIEQIEHSDPGITRELARGFNSALHVFVVGWNGVDEPNAIRAGIEKVVPLLNG